MTTRPNIVLIKSGMHRTGGLEKYAWRLAEDFCTLGAQVTLLTTGNVAPPFSSPLLRIVCFPIAHSLSLLQLLHFDRACSAYVRKHPAPIILSLDRTRHQTHIRAGNGVHAAYLARRKLEEGSWKRLSFSINPLHHAILSLEKKAFEDPTLNLLFTNSHMVKEEILHHYDIDPNKIRTQHNGVEWHKWTGPFREWQQKKPEAIRKYGLDPLAYQFLFIGHNYHRKGLAKLLNALAAMDNTAIQLSVIGKEKDLPFFQHKVHVLGLKDKVFFFGPSEDILSFYQLADALVIPSSYDPFANVTVEALAMGVFVVSSKYNGGSEVLTDVSGAVVPNVEDPECFAECLEHALQRRKTPCSALQIRNGVEHLDFSMQLRQMTKAILN